MIFKKWEMALRNNLIPIVCIGEKLENRNSWKEIIADQLHLFLNHLNHLNQPNNTNQQQMHNNTIFAYEPVWSIGTGLIPTSEEISERSRFIKELLGDTTRLLYGGSVNPNNAAQILECQNVDGLLIGGASLKIDEFKKIIEIAKHSCSE
jgi:triosephosphate isomerase